MCTNHCSDIFGCTREDFKEYWGFKLKRLREESPDLFGSKYQPVKVNLWFIPRPYFWHWIRLLISGTCLAFGFALSSQRSKFFIYLTSWSLLLAFSTDLIQVIRSTVSSNVNPGKSKRKDLYSAEKIQWTLHNCNNTISVVVCLFYWIMVFPVVPPPKTDLSWADRILSHGVIASCVLLDLLLYNVRPFRKRHFYMPVIFGLAYVTFSLIYNIVGGTNYIAHGANPYIYAKLNWNQPEVPGTLGYVSLVLLALLALHFLLYLVNSLFRRNWRFTELCWSCWAGRDTGKVRGEESSSDGARLTVPLTQDYENEKI